MYEYNVINIREVLVPPKTPSSGKQQNLKQQGTFNRRSESVRAPLFDTTEFFDPEDLVQVKYEMLRRVQVDKNSVTESASAFGFSRLTFYQTKQAFQREGLNGLTPRKRGPQQPHKLTAEVMRFIVEQFEDEPKPSWKVLAERVKERFDLVVNPRSIERSVKLQEKKRRGRRPKRRRGE